MYLLLPFFHVDFLEAAAIRDLNGFPAARPFNQEEGTVESKLNECCDSIPWMTVLLKT